MLRISHFLCYSAAAVLALALTQPTNAQGWGWNVPTVKTKADIDTLKADIRFDRGQWLLTVQYEVEVKRPHSAALLDLELALTERKHQVFDASGQPAVLRVPLVRPSSGNRKGDKVVFRDVISVYLPDGIFHRAKDLRVEGRVIAADFGRVLDRKNTSVKFDRRGPWIASGIGVVRHDAYANRHGNRW